MEDTDDLARRLGDRLVEPFELTVTNNLRTMASWGHRQGAVKLRLHKMFLEAPDHVLDALGDLIEGRDLGARAMLRAYIDEHRDMIRRPSRRRRGTPHGRWFDLEQILDDLNDRLLGSAFEGRICWSRRPPARRRRTIRLGSYHHGERLVRIHPALDRPFVPRYFVEWVVYHEMLHQIVGVGLMGGRRQLHSRRFRELEACFPQFERARAWEEQNIDRLLRG